MDAPAGRAFLDRYLREVWVDRDPEAVRRFIGPGYLRHRAPTLDPLDADAQVERLRGFASAFPDITITVEDVVVPGDRIAFRSTMRGTHRGEFLGVAATGRTVEVTLVDIMRIEAERIVEQWGGPDLHDLVRQLTAG